MKRKFISHKKVWNYERKPRRKKTDLRKAKDKLWNLCKSIIRARYGNTCFTCGKTNLEGSGWHTGHFIAKSTCSTSLAYDLDNLRPQCYNCNINKSGNWIEFEAKLIEEKGKDFVSELKRKNGGTKAKSHHLDWYLSKIEEYNKL